MKTHSNIVMVAVLLLELSGLSMGQQKTTKHEYVDLGLPSGTLWATCNIGADTPEGFGDYFAWGETKPKSQYNWGTYRFCKEYEDEYDYLLNGKYCCERTYSSKGENLTVLQLDDDAAWVNWGKDWCMPTRVQWEELMENTNNTLTMRDGVYGRLFVASNGNSIFLPAARARMDGSKRLSMDDNDGYYWSSSCNDKPNGRPMAYAYGFNSKKCFVDDEGMERSFGYSVRAVRSKENSSNTNSSKTNSSKTESQSTTSTKKQQNQQPSKTKFEGEIFSIVEQMPSFPGSVQAQTSFIEKNLQYPKIAQDNGIQGLVYVSFVVEPDGSISNVQVLRGIGGGCDEEAVRLMKSMPKWNPGKQGGKAVRVSYTLPINFKPQQP